MSAPGLTTDLLQLSTLSLCSAQIFLNEGSDINFHTSSSSKQSPHFAINSSGANRQGRAEDFALKFVLPQMFAIKTATNWEMLVHVLDKIPVLCVRVLRSSGTLTNRFTDRAVVCCCLMLASYVSLSLVRFATDYLHFPYWWMKNYLKQ